MTRFVIQRSGPLKGSVRVPGDKSIGHRALIFGALGRGTSTITGLSGGLDNVATAVAFQQMGARIETASEATLVEGVGLHGLRMPKDPIDCGNSGTTMRLLAGLLSAQQFGSRLVGDASLSRRPMGRIIDPLRARGAHIAGVSGAKPDELYPPVSIAPLLEGEALSGIDFHMPVPSAQVKSALLLSGLYAKGPTAIQEPFVSRDHTERMMVALGVPLKTAASVVVLDPTEDWSGGWDGFDWQVPGDPSSAAFVLLAGLMVPGSAVEVTDVCINPTRTGLFDLVRLMGAPLGITPTGQGAGDEPMASVSSECRPLRGAALGGELLVRMIDEVPALCALAAITQGQTEIRDATELRVKESDRIAAMAQVLSSFGVTCQEHEDGLSIDGGATLVGARVDSLGDHRIAMSAALLGMVAQGQTIIDNVDCVETSFPGFASLLRMLGAHIIEEPS